MSRLDDWGIDLHDLENQIEQALDAEYQRGLEDGADADRPSRVPADLEDARETFEWLRYEIIVHVHHQHDNHAIGFCSHSLCKAYVEHRDSLGING